MRRFAPVTNDNSVVAGRAVPCDFCACVVREHVASFESMRQLRMVEIDHKFPSSSTIRESLPSAAHCPTLQGDVVFHVISSFVAQSVDLSVWQDVQGFGILYLSVIAGEMNLKV